MKNFECKEDDLIELANEERMIAPALDTLETVMKIQGDSDIDDIPGISTKGTLTKLTSHNFETAKILKTGNPLYVDNFFGHLTKFQIFKKTG